MGSAQKAEDHQRSCIASLPRFTIGRDHHGWWVVHDRQDRVGGLFRTREAALHFAAGECEHPITEICVAETGRVIELGAFTADALPPAALARQQPRHAMRARA
ncbi:hypothetical protein [Rhizobium straminoryzae]|uniref:DUF2188 domain-containing protein n=1 Tax=Rhizobium straminoryzae TaxID=1387186 RepID=A0A549TB44_9HYPH|nr:hypothetical protein [Rhizobium straminoryzae]TRL39113.1 hypothetical protein FNA46_10095 [Rhizobium straminoryzae]